MIFDTSDLLSKHGFEDGDILDDFCQKQGFDNFHYHEALCQIVEQHVVPHLEQEVVIYRIGTSHNPIRARFIDGIEALDYEGFILPRKIEVSDEIILQICLECGAVLRTEPDDKPKPLPE